VEVSISGCGVAAGFLATAQPSCSHKYLSDIRGAGRSLTRVSDHGYHWVY
jgi:hypothetical protein